MRLAILGGTFNPVHLAHLALCDEVLAAFDYDLVLLIPSHQNPLKAKAEGASDEDRLAMLTRAIVGHRRLAVDDLELRRKGLSYTIDTVRELEDRYKVTGKIGLILGDDLSPGFSGWYRAQELATRCDLIVARRRTEATLPDFPWPHLSLQNPLLEISSTELRSRIASFGPWHFWVPQAVRRYILSRELYGYRAPWTREIEKLEARALDVLSPKRHRHSRGVAQLASHLCSRFDLDPSSGYLAGIAHDICKEMPAEDMRALALSDGKPLTILEERKPALLHARAAAVYLEQEFNVRDQSILEAVRLHTSAASGMGDLAKVLYIADKIEPSRLTVDPVLREAAWVSELDELYVRILKATSRFLLEEGKEIAPSTLEALAAYGESV